MWSHFSTQFAGTVFAMLWGFPFLVKGLGWSEVAAGTLLMVMVGWVVVSGIVLGAMTARWPYYRTWIVMTVTVVMAVAWAAVLLQPEPPAAWLVILMCFATASGGPASLIGFDLARTFTPVQAIGRANGIVNIGGFGASLLAMALIGIVLDVLEPRGMDAYSYDDFRVALSVQFLFWAFGCVQLVRYRRRALDHLQRVHPGAVEELRSGRGWVHPGLGEEGV
jgi:MFS family permease